MMGKKKLIIWDFDGPIVDSRELALELTQFEYHDVTEDIHRNLFNGNIFEELSKLSKKDFTEEQLREFLDTDYWPRKMKTEPTKGIPEILESLSVDFQMTINSSSPDSRIRAYLEKHGLSGYFLKIYGAEISKDKKKKFQLILRDFDLRADDCLLVTDTLGDVLDAQTVKIPSIAVLWGYQEKRHFEAVKENVIFAEDSKVLENAIRKHFEKAT